MPAQKLKDFLDKHNVKYVSMSHSPAFTAQEVAASAHISGWDMAKSVMVKVDGRLAMVVVPAPAMIDFKLLKKASGADHVELATEEEFRQLFPGCEAGAMPPFGNLWNLKVYVDDELANDEWIAFNAGSHSELMRVDYADFARLVNPIKARLTSMVSTR